MSDALRIDVATACDIPALVDLAREYWAFEGIAGFDAQRAARALEALFASIEVPQADATPAHAPQRRPLGAAWIARDGDRDAGYLIGVYVFSLEQSGVVAELDEFFLRPPYRGSGLGARMLAVAEEGFRRAGCTGMFMEVGRDNDRARRFYEQHGFQAREGFFLMEKAL